MEYEYAHILCTAALGRLAASIKLQWRVSVLSLTTEGNETNIKYLDCAVM